MANPTLTSPPTRRREPWHQSAPPSHRPNIFLATVRGLMQRHWTFEVGAALLVFVLVALLLTPWIAPHDPATQDLANRLAGPSAEHWLGTDHLGRDVLSRLMWGGRFSVTIAGITLIICVVSGTILGALAGRRGGWIDELVMRTVDVLVCFPDVVIALFLIALFGTGYGTLIAALSIAGWTPFARLMRGLALEINAKEYVEAAEILGSPKWFILFRHVIPNALPPVAAMSFLRFGHKLITVGALSYLSLGVQPPDSDWGAMLLDAQPYMERAPWVGILPGAAIFLTALSVTMIGQGLDVPKKRRTTARTTGASGTPAEEPASRTTIEEGEAL